MWSWLRAKQLLKDIAAQLAGEGFLAGLDGQRSKRWAADRAGGGAEFHGRCKRGSKDH
jgi:hypothetical protein